MPAITPHAVGLALAAVGLCALPLVVVFRPSWLVRGLLAPLLPAVLFRGPAQRRELVLTIDDGPSPATATSPGSGALLARVVPELRRRGYRFISLEALTAPPL